MLGPGCVLQHELSSTKFSLLTLFRKAMSTPLVLAGLARSEAMVRSKRQLNSGQLAKRGEGHL